MGSEQYIRNIKKFALVSFLLPLIAINSCFLLYKLLGSVDIYFKLDWDKSIIQLTPFEYKKLASDYENAYSSKTPEKIYSKKHVIIRDGFFHVDMHKGNNVSKKTKNIINKSFVNCPENEVVYDWEVINNEKFFVYRASKDKKNKRCIKNYPLIYIFLKNFNWLEKILVETKAMYTSDFAEVKNPYIYGEVSISRTARYFPATVIFKVLIILSAIFLFFYWISNLKIFNNLKNNNVINSFSKTFFYFGISSCIFLILHAAFLGLDFESKLFNTVRKLIIILFILSEVIAQIFLTKNLFKYKEKLKNYIYMFILKLKIIFVTIIFVITLISFAILIYGDPSTSFKHILEWNYFSFLLLYYFFSTLLWKSIKN